MRVAFTHLPVAGHVNPTLALTRELVERGAEVSAFAVGPVVSALAGAGVVFQALFRNPLADPFVMGISGGAATPCAPRPGISASWAWSSRICGSIGRPSRASFQRPPAAECSA